MSYNEFFIIIEGGLSVELQYVLQHGKYIDRRPAEGDKMVVWGDSRCVERIDVVLNGRTCAPHSFFPRSFFPFYRPLRMNTTVPQPCDKVFVVY